MDNKCKMKMLDLYFSKFEFNQVRGENSDELNTSFTIEYATDSDDKSNVRVKIDTVVSSKEKNIVLNLQTVGIFKIDTESTDDQTYNRLVKANTVAIIFPYIRSQISLLTTQPGISPIMLPPIDINSLIDNDTVKSDTE